MATAYIEREAHPVSGFDPLHRRSYFLNHAQMLVTEDAALLEVRSSRVHVQIGPADAARRCLTKEKIVGTINLIRRRTGRLLLLRSY